MVNSKAILGFIAAAAIVVVGATIAVVVLVLPGEKSELDGGGAEPASFTVAGSLQVIGCSSRGYSDLEPGAQVTVQAQDGSVLGIGTLLQSGDSYGCARTFTVPNVPAGLSLYGVAVGNKNRGVIWRNEQDARNGFALTIGDR